MLHSQVILLLISVALVQMTAGAPIPSPGLGSNPVADLAFLTLLPAGIFAGMTGAEVLINNAADVVNWPSRGRKKKELQANNVPLACPVFMPFRTGDWCTTNYRSFGAKSMHVVDAAYDNWLRNGGRPEVK